MLLSRGQREGRHTPSDPELTGQSRKRCRSIHSTTHDLAKPSSPVTGPQESAAVSARSERSISYAIAAAAGRQGGEPILARLDLAFRPLDQEPLFGVSLGPIVVPGGRPQAHGGEAGIEFSVGSFTPGDRNAPYHAITKTL